VRESEHAGLVSAIYFQLSLRVKVRVVEYCREINPSEPLATVWVVVESGKEPAHDPDPPSPVTFTDEQDTVTAETGTVGQLPNAGDAAWTDRVQLLPDPRAVQEAVVVALPATTGTVPGLTALKEIVAGVTVSVKFPWALGVIAMG
jgi:hypothetical protein